MLFKKAYPAGFKGKWRGAQIGRLRAYVTVRLVEWLFARYIAFTDHQNRGPGDGVFAAARLYLG